MTGIQWAVVSYRRPQVCAASTVATLLSGGVDPEALTVFLSDPSEADEYAAALAGTGVAIRDGAPGAAGNKRASQRFYEPGTRLVSCDDDLDGLLAKPSTGNRLVPVGVPLPVLAAGAFDRAAEAGAAIWGLCGAAASLYLHHSETAGLRYVIGCFYGSVTPDPDVCRDDLLESHGEDFVVAVRSFLRHGAVYRLDWLTAKTRYFAEGGIDAEATNVGTIRQAEHAAALRRLAAMYPTLCSAYVKAGGVVNLRLNPVTAFKRPRPVDTYAAAEVA